MNSSPAAQTESDSPARNNANRMRFIRRRIAAVVGIGLVIVAAVATGVSVQKRTDWSPNRLTADQKQDLVSEASEHETAVAINPDEHHEWIRSGDGNGRFKPKRNKSKEQPPTLRNTRHSEPLYKAPAPGSMSFVTVKSHNAQRHAVVRVPKDATWRKAKGGTPKPLILAFHGYGQDAGLMSRFSDLYKEGAIVVYPNGVGNAWAGAPYAETTGAQDKQFVRDLINRTAATYKVDDKRIYAAGMSNGGGFVAKLACDMPEEFAAFASVAGAYYEDTWSGCAAKGKAGQGTHPKFARGKADSFLEIHGRADDRIYYEGGERYGTQYLGAMAYINAYSLRAGCFGAPKPRQITRDVLRVQWPACQKDAEIVHLAVDGMGHTWPGEGEDARPGESSIAGAENNGPKADPTRALNASSEVLAFFKRHTK